MNIEDFPRKRAGKIKDSDKLLKIKTKIADLYCYDITGIARKWEADSYMQNRLQ